MIMSLLIYVLISQCLGQVLMPILTLLVGDGRQSKPTHPRLCILGTVPAAYSAPDRVRAATIGCLPVGRDVGCASYDMTGQSFVASTLPAARQVYAADH
jgi:hypothetical protein